MNGTKKNRHKKMKEKILYFAYGSNMDAEQMARRCPEATFIAKAQLKGYRFLINKRGVATIVFDANSIVFGLVWHISERDEQSLDEFEGVHYGTYSKQHVSVELENRTTEQVIVYIANNNNSGTPRENYLERIIAAAENNTFPDDYLVTLKKIAKKRRGSDDQERNG
ncbi:MAG: gamma-glutamylcyclotransferase family protein [Nitrospirota bacterium]